MARASLRSRSRPAPWLLLSSTVRSRSERVIRRLQHVCGHNVKRSWFPSRNAHSAINVLHIVSQGGDEMAATSHASVKPRNGVSTLASRWPLLGQRRPLLYYLSGIVILNLAATVFFTTSTELRWPQLLTFAALMGCGAVCIEATRRLGMPAGVSRDLLSAWWLPVALLLPPVYAVLAPIPLQILLQLRVRATVLYRRVFSAAAIGLAAGAASGVFHRWVPHPADLYGGSGRPIAVAAACAVVFTVLNTALIAVAAHTADPEG